MDTEQLVAQENKLTQLLNQILQMATEYGAVVRVLGALAFRVHCPQFKYIEYKLGRQLTDIDLVANSRHHHQLEKMFTQLGWSENKMVKVFTAGKRLLFIAPDGMHFDIFFDRIDMCHEINLKGRLEIDYPTISLVDLLLEKMQIVQINEKDLIDTMVLLLEHDIGDTSEETIDVRHLRSLCASDWGLWRTVTMNLEKVKTYLSSVPELSEQERQNGEAKVARLLQEIEGEPKSLKWRMRAKVGDKKKWYRDVEEIIR